MQIAILQLSDIHIMTSNDAILTRAKKICEALHATAPNALACIVLISGDVAYGGEQAQYDIAYSFFDTLRCYIKDLPSIEKVEFIVIPGNHDCNFNAESDLRSLLLHDQTALYESRLDLDGDVIRSLLSVQDNFFHFEARLCNSKEVPIANRLAFGRIVTVRNFSLKFQCFNTAWLSRKKELQSKLFFPEQALEPIPGNATLCISTFHHPYNWLDSNNYRLLRDSVEQTSDLVFTGHEHVAGGGGIQRFSGEHLHYIDGAALQGENGELDSAFNIVMVDLQTEEQRTEFLKWNGDIYVSRRPQKFSSLIKNPARQRQLLRPNTVFMQSLNELGMGFKHPRVRVLALRDIYVYPCLSSALLHEATKEGKRPHIIQGKDVIQHFRKTKNVLIVGEDDSGKTALLRSLYTDLGDECVPLLLQGQSLGGKLNETRFMNMIRQAVTDQYDEVSVDRFLREPPSHKLLLIDNFHMANFTRSNERQFLSFAANMFGQIIVAVSDIYGFHAMLGRDERESPFKSYERCDIRPFGHFLRGGLIKKWLALGRETASELEVLQREAPRMEKVITSLLGKNVVPSYPFTILTLLQMYESSQSHMAIGTSFGHLYESLIKASLTITSVDGNQEADFKFTYISSVAFAMFESNTQTISDAQLKQIHDEHRDRFHIALDLQHTVADLVAAGIFDNRDGNYSFRYKHYYFYFVAKYFERALKRGDLRSGSLRDKLSYVADRLHNEEYANITLFFVHLTQDWTLISRIIANAKKIYANKQPCNFDNDVDFVNRLFKETPKKLVVDVGDIDKNREDYNKGLDEDDEESQIDVHVSLDAKLEYDDSLSDMHKMNIAIKTLQVLGQVLRSAASTLEGDEKLKISEACYMLGLRSFNVILDLVTIDLEMLRYYIAAIIKERHAFKRDEINESTLLRRTDEAIIQLLQVCGFGMLKKISYSIGHPRLGETYQRILEAHKDNTAIRLIDLQVKLDHLSTIPEYDISSLRDKVVRNPFARSILTIMIADFLYLYKTDIRTRQKLGSMFDIQASDPQYLLPGEKMI